MVFIIIFVVISFLIPLTLEIYWKGSNNIISQVGKEIGNSKSVKAISNKVSILNSMLERTSSIAIGASMIFIFIVLSGIFLQFFRFVFKSLF